MPQFRSPIDPPSAKRWRVHFLRSALARAGKGQRPVVLTAINIVFAQEPLDAAIRRESIEDRHHLICACPVFIRRDGGGWFGGRSEGDRFAGAPITLVGPGVLVRLRGD